jgi:hypothetical protein
MNITVQGNKCKFSTSNHYDFWRNPCAKRRCYLLYLIKDFHSSNLITTQNGKTKDSNRG